jgi:DNA-binding NarL/FixJ family response regulator
MQSHASFPSNLEIRPVRILLVDDAARVRNELRQLLELSGAVKIVGEAGDGLEAVRLAAALMPDVILMDLEMPVLDGYEATARIKTGQSGLRVVILSVHAGPGEVERARAAGADDFVVKGAGYQTLLDAILEKDGSTNSFNKGDNS